MRIVAGFLLGALAVVAAFLIAQHLKITPIADQIGYYFDTCVFGTEEFPGGDLDNGRLLRRAFVPVQVDIRFYDAAFHEVQKAVKAGRYGAVVRIRPGFGPATYRFITLYRTPAAIQADIIHIPITAKFPATEFGLDATTVRMQQDAIGAALQNMIIDYEDGQSPETVAILLAGLAETGPGEPAEHLHNNAKTRNDAWWYELQTRLGLAPTYHYLVDLPHGYDDDSTRHWPLILFLHHADAGGSDLHLVRECALAGLIQRGREVPAIVVSPQCPEAQSWSTPVLTHLIDEMAARYRVDPDRIYITGVSAGGDETWDLTLDHPDRFAAIVPVSGESDPGDAAQLRDVPVWGFQGGKDASIDPGQMAAMVEAVRKAGGHAHLTVYPDSSHDCWDQAYSTEALWTWLLAQKRGQPEVSVPGMPNL